MSFYKNPEEYQLRLFNEDMKFVLFYTIFKISPLTYPEKSWLFLKHSKEAFCKNEIKNVLPDCLGAAWKSKKCKKIIIWPKRITFHTEKDLKSNNVMGKKVYILARDVNL